MGPKVLVDAVTAVKLRNTGPGFDEEEMKLNEISALAAERLLGGDGRPSLPRGLMSSADLTTLRQLQSAVEYFIDDYCSQELPVLFNSPSTPASDLSSTMLARLQRAFYRFDICRTMWFYPGSAHDQWHHKIWMYDPRELLSKTTPWEIEEIACIWQYLHNDWTTSLLGSDRN